MGAIAIHFNFSISHSMPNEIGFYSGRDHHRQLMTIKTFNRFFSNRHRIILRIRETIFFRRRHFRFRKMLKVSASLVALRRFGCEWNWSWSLFFFFSFFFCIVINSLLISSSSWREVRRNKRFFIWNNVKRRVARSPDPVPKLIY